jgi:hypothetical protein
MVRTYDNLGMVAQHRGDLAATENWYRNSLAIANALGDRPGMARSYGQLGLLAEARAREDLAAALDWIVRGVTLSPTSRTLRPAGRRARRLPRRPGDP